MFRLSEHDGASESAWVDGIARFLRESSRRYHALRLLTGNSDFYSLARRTISRHSMRWL